MNKAMRVLTMLLAVCTALNMVSTAAFAASVFTVKIPVQYGQTEARGVINYINTYRRSKLKYDYQLEQAAMQRAAEVAIYSSHNRPDGSDYKTACPGRTDSRAECLSLGDYTAASVVYSMMVSNDGHWEILMDKRYNAVGVGHAVVDGIHYWALEFGSKVSTAKATAANNSSTTVPARVSTACVKVQLRAAQTQITATQGQTLALPAAYLIFDTLMGKVYIPAQPTWQSGNAAVATVSGSKATAVKTGAAKLAAKVSSDVSTSLTMKVQPSAMERAVIKLSASSFIYSGKAVKPTVKVSVDGRTLVQNRDYTLSYANNTKAGTGSVTVTGRGSYGGSVVKTFQIYLKKPEVSRLENTASGIKVTWKAVTGAAKYRVFAQDSKGTWKKLGDTASTSLTVKGYDGKNPFKSGVRYAFSVRCISGDGKTFTSDFNKTGKSVLCLLSPSVSKAASSAKGKVAVSWGKGAGAVGYQLQYTYDKNWKRGVKTLTVSKASTCSTVISGLTKGKTVYIRLRSYAKDAGKMVYAPWSAVKKASVTK